MNVITEESGASEKRTWLSLKEMRSSMEVNWLNTMALPLGSRCSIRCSSSLTASILVLLRKPASPTRLMMLSFLLPATREAVAYKSMDRHIGLSFSDDVVGLGCTAQLGGYQKNILKVWIAESFGSD